MADSIREILGALSGAGRVDKVSARKLTIHLCVLILCGLVIGGAAALSTAKHIAQTVQHPASNSLLDVCPNNVPYYKVCGDPSCDYSDLQTAVNAADADDSPFLVKLFGGDVFTDLDGDHSVLYLGPDKGRIIICGGYGPDWLQPDRDNPTILDAEGISGKRVLRVEGPSPCAEWHYPLVANVVIRNGNLPEGTLNGPEGHHEDGAGILAVDSNLRTYDVKVEDNVAFGQGGGMNLNHQCPGPEARIRSVRIVDNTAGERGGGLALIDVDAGIRLVVFQGNTAIDGDSYGENGGGAAYIEAANPIVAQVTFNNNEDPVLASVKNGPGASPLFENTIWVGSEPGSTAVLIIGCGYVQFKGNTVIDDNILDLATGGHTTPYIDPEKVIQGDPKLGPDSHIVDLSSVAFDAADNCAGEEDVDGEVMPAPHSDFCDVGADELTHAAQVAVKASRGEIQPGDSVVFTKTVTNTSAIPVSFVVLDNPSAGLVPSDTTTSTIESLAPGTPWEQVRVFQVAMDASGSVSDRLDVISEGNLFHETVTSTVAVVLPPTDTATPTPTSTATATATPTPTSTPTATGTATSTPTSTATNTPTSTATNTPTSTPTATGTATSTPTSTATNSPSPTPDPTPAHRLYLPLVLRS